MNTFTTSSQAHKSKQFSGITGRDKIPKPKRYLFNLIVEESESASEAEEWSIYPNPASEYINIRRSKGQSHMNMDLEIINASGQSVYRKVGVNLHKDGNRIAIHELPSGMYILRLHTADKEIQLPFVKIRP